MGAEIVNRAKLRDALVELDAWSAWTGLTDPVALKSRIGWPISKLVSLDSLPVVVLNIGAGGRVNQTGYADSSSNFRAFGSIVARFFDRIHQVDDLEAEEERFGGHVTDMVDEYVNRVEDFSPLTHSVTYSENPFVMAPLNVWWAEDADADGADDPQSIDVWMSEVAFSWGVR